MDKKEIALSVGGTLASMVVAYLIYRLEKQQPTPAAAPDTTVTSAGSFYTVPSVTLPSLTQVATTSTAPTQTYDTSGINSELDKIVAAFTTGNAGHPVTSATTPVGAIAALPLQTNNLSSLLDNSGSSGGQMVLTSKHLNTGAY